MKNKLETLWKKIDKKSEGKPTPTEEDILEEIQNYRREKSKKA